MSGPVSGPVSGGDGELKCPVCGTPASGEPLHCAVCGYRAALAKEYLWIFGGGIAASALGFAVGALGVYCQGSSAEHWSREALSHFPIVPWPRSSGWLALLLSGIVLTICGLGLTRQRGAAGATLLALLAYEIVLSIRALLAGAGTPAWSVLFLCASFLPLLLRVQVALGRTPPRDALTQQERAARMEQAAQQRRAAETSANEAAPRARRGKLTSHEDTDGERHH